jgi:hypothetical protein
MKATIRYQKIEGFVSPTGWLFVKGIKSKGSSFPVAKVVKTDTGYEIAYIEPEQQLRDFTNAEIAAALLS